MAEVVEVSRAVPREEARAHLEQVLASVHFRNSRRCSALLRYVVEQTLEHPGEPIKERIIGQAVFDRTPGYDTNQDAVVRNAAAEVRKRLAQYYVEAGASAGGLRLELPPGSYVPEFRTEAATATVKAEAPGARLAPWLMLVVGMAAGAMLTVGLGARHPAATELDQFWAPILAAHPPVQICVGQSRMNYLPGRLPDEAARDPKATVPVNRLLPLRDRFLWWGDAMTTARMSAYLTAHDKLYRVRGALITPYAELQGNPVVLVGAFNNEWTLRLTQDLRFSLVNDGPDTRGVRDREKGPGMLWQVTRSPQGWIADEDYAVVTRLADPVTGQTVIAAGGITTYGTQAAGNFVTTPEEFREALKEAPKDWARKNMQVVLQTKVADGTPGPPRVLAAYFW